MARRRSPWCRVIKLFAEPLLEVAFFVMTTLCCFLFLLDEGPYIELTPLVGISLMVVWCPLWWWKFWYAKTAGALTAWFFLVMAVVLTSLMLIDILSYFGYPVWDAIR